MRKLLYILIPLIISYLIYSFENASFNINNWSVYSREQCMTSTFILTVLGILLKNRINKI
jgi:hypothetical protein